MLLTVTVSQTAQVIEVKNSESSTKRRGVPILTTEGQAATSDNTSNHSVFLRRDHMCRPHRNNEVQDAFDSKCADYISRSHTKNVQIKVGPS